LKDNMMLDCTD